MGRGHHGDGGGVGHGGRGGPGGGLGVEDMLAVNVGDREACARVDGGAI